MKYIAHRDAESEREQGMVEHLENTAELAAEFAHVFGARESAYFCGMLHDIGKYSDKFQRRIRGSNEQVDHATAGAKLACENNDVVSAVCIAGHHTGLPDLGTPMDSPKDATFGGRLKREVEDYSVYLQEIAVTKAAPLRKFMSDNEKTFFFTHMLYSCLVDADWLDTEDFFTPGKRTNEYDECDVLVSKLEQYISGWWSPQNEIDKRRCIILRNALDNGGEAPGMFSLTVPTGGGKTIASMAFALKHILANDMRRVIYVIPYVSILEQTQKVFEEAFGEQNVVAHYSNVEFGDDDKRYLATENWDAPIILTTSVQFFESLFANKSSRCRKLHNIAKSVVIFDEAQMLPFNYLGPCVWAISQLAADYGCSAVLCTATQPSLDSILKKYLPDAPVSELCPDVKEMYEYFRRVRYENEGKCSNEELSERLGSEKAALCIVNGRKRAKELFGILDSKDSFYLTTTMTPINRRSVLYEIRKRLKAGLPCRVVATSLIEAGVDVDFPVVWREIAGLDSIIQAGGRCNREGKREFAESIVHIFEAEKPPPQIFAQNISATRSIMRDFEDISSPPAIAAYFQFLYYTLKGEKALDSKEILIDIHKGTMPFKSIANRFKIIENDQYTVYVPHDEASEKMIGELKENGPSRKLMRRLGQYAVNVYPDLYNDLYSTGAVEQFAKDAAILVDLKLYNEKTGLLLESAGGRDHFV